MLQHLLFIFWNPSPDVFPNATYSIKWYGVLWGISLMTCFYIGTYIFRKLNKDEEKVTYIIQYAFLFGILGARLLQVCYYHPEIYIADPWEIPKIWHGGLASHGGVIGGLIGVYIFSRRNKGYDFFWTLDHGIITIPILAALVRFGNLMNSELYGKPTQEPWGFIFALVDNVPRHPVVLYESMAYLLIQFLMLYLFNKYKESKPGLYLVVFLVLVFGARFMLEFFKVPEGDMIGIISKTQILNLPFIFTGLVLSYFVATNKLHYKQAANG